MSGAGPEIERLMALLSKLPGLGPRSARRAALALLKRRDQLLIPLTHAMQDAADKIEFVPYLRTSLDAKSLHHLRRSDAR
ncbi:Recombination protein RecR [Asticcacaulis sp. MM231]